jgi:hypothetical protein
VQTHLPKTQALEDLVTAPGPNIWCPISRIHEREPAFRALLRAIKSARELIYIEGAAFTATSYGTDTANDLVTAIQNRLNAMPGLRVILYLPKNLDYGPGYEPFAAREFARRKEAVEKLLGRNKLFTIDSELIPDLDAGKISDNLRTAFASQSVTLSTDVAVTVITAGSRWEIEDRQNAKEFQVRGDGTSNLQTRYSQSRAICR